MPDNYYFGYYFYAPNGRFEPCGMFTFPHIVTAIFCVIGVVIALCFTKNYFKGEQRKKLLRCSALTLTILEAAKITHCFIHDNLYLDAWFPLSYCSLFIIALWISGYCKTPLKYFAEAFISFGCPFAGIAFLVFPTTSLMSYPIWHFFSLYSMIYHSLMLFIGITLLRQEANFTFQKYKNYCIFVMPFSVVAISLNAIFGSNLMNLREPYNIPIQFLQNLYINMPQVFTLFVLICYLAIPFIVAFLGNKLEKSIK